MLAKEIKIKTLKKQRKFIEKQLKGITTCREDGNDIYVYVGHVHPEVIKYFESEGFDVTIVRSEMFMALTKGMPAYVFTVGDIKLTEEELKQAEEYDSENEDDEGDDDDPSSMIRFLQGLL